MWRTSTVCRHHIVRGGAETTYPEYRQKMGKPEHPLQVCQLYCACGQRDSPPVCVNLGAARGAHMDSRTT